ANLGGGLTVGFGPVLAIPTASDDALGSGKWGAGPTVVILKQAGPWTYGALVNHVWSFAGDSDRGSVNATFLQPFLSHTSKKATTLAVNTETTYDWVSDAFTIPVNVTVAQLVTWGKQRVSLTGGVRYWVEAPAAGPEGLGLRVAI